jgi:hypothetical protein
MDLNYAQQQIFNEIAENNIFLYCTPKCGGTSLLDSLEKYYKTIHIHSQLFFEKFYKDKDIINNAFKIIDCIEESRKNNSEIFIIDVYRQPIERNMSYFFHIIQDILPDFNDKTIDELIHFFNTDMYFQYGKSIDEIINYYNINLYEKPFDHDKMYLEYKFENINFIILHFDYINNWETILEYIFKRRIDLSNSNSGEQKTYSQIYKDYKNNYRIPNIILEFIKNEFNFNYFNNEDMKKKYIDFWEKRIDDTIEINEIPADFDLERYKLKNVDLERMNNLELLWHYSLFGKNEDREY